MKSTRFPSTARRALFVLSFFCLVLPISAQTLLLAVQEATKSGPLSPPLAIREGVAEGLFAAGIIVVEVPPGYERPADLAAFGRGAGADYILDVSAIYTEASTGANRASILVTTAFTLIDASTGAPMAKETDEATNKDRETRVDRTALGIEIGARIVARVEKALGNLASAQ
jgi:hypothetical protein